MDVLEHASSLHLTDERVAVCGDWHGNLSWLRTLARAITRLAPGVTTVLQLGDWWMDTEASDRIFADAGIERVYVVLGNHEPWPWIVRLFDARPGDAVRVSDVTWILPRPARLCIGGREVLSLGGASSVDRAYRTEGRDWWAEEAITDEHVDAAIAGGAADIMLTHESPAGTPVRAVRDLLSTNPFGFPQEALAESEASRARVTRVWDAVRPTLLMHGHLHVSGGGVMADGRRVVSMGSDAEEGNLAFLNMQTLEVDTPSLRQIREAANRGW